MSTDLHFDNVRSQDGLDHESLRCKEVRRAVHIFSFEIFPLPQQRLVRPLERERTTDETPQVNLAARDKADPRLVLHREQETDCRFRVERIGLDGFVVRAPSHLARSDRQGEEGEQEEVRVGESEEEKWFFRRGIDTVQIEGRCHWRNENRASP